MKSVLIILFIFITVEGFSQATITREEWLQRNYEENLEQVSDENRVVFRLNWWRAFHPLTIIRVENLPVEFQDTLYVQHFAVSKVYRDDFNDYSHPTRPFIFEQQVCIVSKQDFEKLKDLANQLDIWNVKSDSILQLDGSNWELEIYMNGRYHLVSSNSVNPTIKKIGLEMIKLSCLKLKEKEVY